jgi:hypothetical protein
MSFDSSQVNLTAVIIGAAVWAVALCGVWLWPRKDAASHRDNDFAVWKSLNKKPNASFAEFLSSEEAPRVYLSRVDLSAALLAMALLALIFTLRSWGAWQ